MVWGSFIHFGYIMSRKIMLGPNVLRYAVVCAGCLTVGMCPALL